MYFCTSSERLFITSVESVQSKDNWTLCPHPAAVSLQCWFHETVPLPSFHSWLNCTVIAIFSCILLMAYNQQFVKLIYFSSAFPLWFCRYNKISHLRPAIWLVFVLPRCQICLCRISKVASKPILTYQFPVLCCDDFISAALYRGLSWLREAWLSLVILSSLLHTQDPLVVFKSSSYVLQKFWVGNKLEFTMVQRSCQKPSSLEPCHLWHKWIIMELTLACSQAPTQPLTYPLHPPHPRPVGRGEKIERIGVRRLGGRRKDRDIAYQVQTWRGDFNWIYCQLT